MIRKEALNDENLARDMANRLGVTFHLLQIDVEAEAKRLSEYASSQFASLDGSAIVSELPIYLLSRKK